VFPEDLEYLEFPEDPDCLDLEDLVFLGDPELLLQQKMLQ
jgi:hypothetical protein